MDQQILQENQTRHKVPYPILSRDYLLHTGLTILVELSVMDSSN
jgi:hypothetical protein